MGLIEPESSRRAGGRDESRNNHSSECDLKVMGIVTCPHMGAKLLTSCTTGLSAQEQTDVSLHRASQWRASALGGLEKIESQALCGVGGICCILVDGGYGHARSRR